MLRIERISNEGVVLRLSGRISVDDVAELHRVLSLEASGEEIALDLRDVTLVDRDAMQFLAECDAGPIKLVNCPAYIRGSLDRGREQNNEHLPPPGPARC